MNRYFSIIHIPSARTLKLYPLHDGETKEQILGFFLDEEYCKYIVFDDKGEFDFCRYNYDDAVPISSRLEFLVEELYEDV